MLYDEWDMDTALAVSAEDGRDEMADDVIALIDAGFTTDQLRKIIIARMAQTRTVTGSLSKINWSA